VTRLARLPVALPGACRGRSPPICVARMPRCSGRRGAAWLEPWTSPRPFETAGSAATGQERPGGATGAGAPTQPEVTCFDLLRLSSSPSPTRCCREM